MSVKWVKQVKDLLDRYFRTTLHVESVKFNLALQVNTITF